MSSPDRLGPWLLESVLGRGASGVVHLARHRDGGPLVALKVVRSPDVSPQLLRREIHALARLDHPQIVRVLDQGEHDGLTWCATSYVEGADLRGVAGERFSVDTGLTSHSTFVATEGTTWLGELASNEVPGRVRAAPVHAARGRLTEVLGLIRALCVPLAYLHGEGVVHRDLKPENVIVRDDGVPIVVDFGITVAFAGARGRERIDGAGAAAGTPAYMAPEQIRGQLVDARADLYALGCILYELLTGNPPFVGTRAAVLRGHLEDEPVAPSERVDGVPPALEQLVLSLLAKEPAERLGYADDVASELARLGAPAPPELGAPPARSYLYRPRLRGRDRELAALSEVLDVARDGVPRVHVIVGPSGVGKSRLALELAQLARSRGMAVVAGAAGAATGLDAPLGVLRPVLQTIADGCRTGGADRTEAWLGHRRGLLARYAPELAELPGMPPARPPEELGRDAERLRLYAWLAEVLSAWTAERPALILLDDLQWADALTIGLLPVLAQTRLPLRLAVVATLRPEAGGAADRILRSPGLRRVDLGPLEREALGEMVQDMLALQAVPDSFRDLVAERSAGNVFLAAELLRAAIADELLTRRRGRWTLQTGGAVEDLPLPRDVASLVDRRLQGTDRELVEAAAILGRRLDVELLAAVVGRAPATVVAAVEVLVAGDVLIQDGSGLGFVHDQVRDAVLERVADDRRRALHAATARALEGRGDPGRLAAVAAHWQAAGERSRCARAALAAARDARRVAALEEALALYTLALDALGDADEVLRIELERAAVQVDLGGFVDARGALEAALVEASRRDLAPERALALAGLTSLAIHNSSAREAHQRASELIEALRRPGAADVVAASRAWRLLATAAQDLGRMEEADDAYERARRHAEAAADDAELSRTLDQLALRRMAAGEAARAERLSQEALVLAERCGLTTNVARNLVNLAAIAWRLGDIERCERLNLQALTLCREQGLRVEEGVVLSNLGNLAQELQDWPRARALVSAALKLAQDSGNRRSEAWDLGELGAIEGILGDVAAADAHLLQGVGLAEELADAYALCHALGLWAEHRRRVVGAPDHQALARMAEAAEACGRMSMRAWAAAEGGLAALCEGRDAAQWLARGRELAAGADDAEAQGHLEALELSIAAAERGEPLLHGEAVELVPGALAARLGVAVGDSRR